jgi:tetratricopeptide (TPR) repeat protein
MRSEFYPTAKPRNADWRSARAAMISVLLGSALGRHRAGHFAEAERIYRQILAIDPGHADSLHLWGMIAHQAGLHDLAAERIAAAIAINGHVAPYHLNLGTIFHSQNMLDEAVACYERALALRPDFAEAHYNLGNARQLQGQLDPSAACYLQALTSHPGLADAHHQMGNVRHSQDRLNDAVECYERAMALNPNLAEAHYNLGHVLHLLDRLDEAMACYERALAVRPDYGQAHFGVALAQLFGGDFAAGWRNYESRWQSEDHGTPMRPYCLPRWTGKTLASGRLLIWGEQGIGDEIMFAGLIPEVVRADNRCVLDCDPRLQPLFARSFPGVEVVARPAAEDAPELDIRAHAPCGSLPGFFRTCRSAFAASTSPYLFADPAEVEGFRAKYRDGRRLVGLAWHTNSAKTGRIRSIDLASLSPLFVQPGVRWVCLQYGDHDALAAEAAQARAPLLVDRAVDQFVDIDRFAAQVAAMEMVVTIDNSTAHLAGALGVRVLLLLPFSADWRWLAEGDESLWYPSMRLFRQAKADDWESVMPEVREALSK